MKFFFYEIFFIWKIYHPTNLFFAEWFFFIFNFLKEFWSKNYKKKINEIFVLLIDIFLLKPYYNILLSYKSLSILYQLKTISLGLWVIFVYPSIHPSIQLWCKQSKMLKMTEATNQFFYYGVKTLNKLLLLSLSTGFIYVLIRRAIIHFRSKPEDTHLYWKFNGVVTYLYVYGYMYVWIKKILLTY